MVELVGLSPCASGVMLWRESGRLRLSAIVKAAFTVPTSGRPVPAAVPELLKDDVLKDNMPTASVRAPSDWFPRRPRGDVTLVGAAQAPGDKPVRKMQVRLTVTRDGKLLLNKSIEVRGDGDNSFTVMPLEYERSYGGLGFPDNPIGVGTSPKDAQPNIVNPRNPEQTTGYGPISATWAGRRVLRGALRRSQLDDAIVELPSGFDFTYFQAAPRDQQIDFLTGREVLIFEGLHGAAERVEVTLPGVRAVGAVFGLRSADGSDRTPLELVCDTLHIDTNVHVLTLTFRGTVDITEAAIDRALVAAGVAFDGAAVAVPDRRPGAPVSSRAQPEPPASSQPSPSQDFGGTVLINPWANPAAARPAPPSAPLPTSGQMAASAPRAPAPTALSHKPSAMAESPFTSTVEIKPDSAVSAPTPFAVAPPSSGRVNAPPLEGAPWSNKAASAPRVPKPAQNVTAPIEVDEDRVRVALARRAAEAQPPPKIVTPAEPPPAPKPPPRIIAAEPSAAAPPPRVIPAEPPSSRPIAAQPVAGPQKTVERPAPWAAGPVEAPPVAAPEPKKPKKMPKKLDANDLIYGGGGPKRKRK